MATFKTVALRQRADGFWNVSIRVTHNRKSRYLKTDKIVETKSVNKKNHEVKDPFVLEACTVKIAHFLISGVADTSLKRLVFVKNPYDAVAKDEIPLPHDAT